MKYEFWNKMGAIRVEKEKPALKPVEDVLKNEVNQGKLSPFAKQYPHAVIRLDEGRLISDDRYKGSLYDPGSGFIVIFSMDEDLDLTIATTMSIQPQPGSVD